MRKFFRTSRVLILLVAVAPAFASSGWPPLDPAYIYQSFLPKLEVTWEGNDADSVGKSMCGVTSPMAVTDGQTATDQNIDDICDPKDDGMGNNDNDMMNPDNDGIEDCTSNCFNSGPVGNPPVTAQRKNDCWYGVCCEAGTQWTSGNDAQNFKKALVQMCHDYYLAIKARLRNECDYITAVRVAIDPRTVHEDDGDCRIYGNTWIWGPHGGYRVSTNPIDQIRYNFFNVPDGASPQTGFQKAFDDNTHDPNANAVPVPPYQGCIESTSPCAEPGGGTFDGWCPHVHLSILGINLENGGDVAHIFGVKFIAHTGSGQEPDCVAHDYTNDHKCPVCFVDRGNTYGGGSSSGGAPSDTSRDEVLMNYPNYFTGSSSGGSSSGSSAIIRSQGCVPASATQSIAQVVSSTTGGGSVPQINIGSFLNGNVLKNPMSLFMPTCLLNPPTLADYISFEHRGDQSYPQAAMNSGSSSGPADTNVYDVIDNEYNAAMGSSGGVDSKGEVVSGYNGTIYNPYKGNCGRGKFFYKNLPAFNSNLTNPANFDPVAFSKLHSSDNDIWQSRTGCYNPEERFAIMPPGQVKFAGSSSGSANIQNPQDPINFYCPTRQVIEIADSFISGGVGALATGIFGINGNYCYPNLDPAAMVPTGTDPLAPTDSGLLMRENLSDIDQDLTFPWDEPLTCGKGRNSLHDIESNCIIPQTDQTDPAQKVTYLIPNDRLLMRHPMCTDQFDTAIGLPNFGSSSSSGSSGGLANAVANLFSKPAEMKNLTTAEDVETKIEHDGSLPVCMKNDFPHEMESYCSHYMMQSTADLSVPGSSGSSMTLPVNLTHNYGTNRYVFDYTNSCWTKPQNSMPTFLDANRYEHWMPLAVRAQQWLAAPGVVSIDSVENPASEALSSITSASASGGISTITDIFGNTQTYTLNDYKRPTFTNYSARVIKDDGCGLTGSSGGPCYTHDIYSLEEYGVSDIPIPREDYSYNPYNIYFPNSSSGGNAAGFARSTLDVSANMGRKAKMQQCLRTYLEQWAFEGDKGAIVLDSNIKVDRNARNLQMNINPPDKAREGGFSVSVNAPDASMCQWVAYYDTSDNYGKDDQTKERNLFKQVMVYYFSRVQDVNNDANKYRMTPTSSGGMGLDPTNDKINLGFLAGSASSGGSNPINPIWDMQTSNQAPGLTSIIPGVLQNFTGSYNDPERLNSSTVNNGMPVISGLAGGFSLSLSPLSDVTTQNLNNMNSKALSTTYQFRRRRGLRPEIFDYYNFLSTSAMAVMDEGMDVTNGTSVGDGNVFGSSIGAVAANLGSTVFGSSNSSSGGSSSGSLTNGGILASYASDLYTMTVPSAPANFNLNSILDMKNSLGYQINMERRNCDNSVIPPHFWRDVIQPPFGPASCDASKGAFAINNFQMSGGIPGLDNFISGAVKDGLSYLTGGSTNNWLTTNPDSPVLSLVTPILGFPVIALGMNYDTLTSSSPTPIFYAKMNLEKFEIPGIGDNQHFYIADNWLSRTGGRAVMNNHLLEQSWVAGVAYGSTSSSSSGGTSIDAINGVAGQYDEDSSNGGGGNSSSGGKYEETANALYNEGYGNYIAYQEVERKVVSGEQLGFPILDEKKFDSSNVKAPSAREWVEHIWPARTCMHAEPIEFAVGNYTIPGTSTGVNTGNLGMANVIDQVGAGGGIYQDPSGANLVSGMDYNIGGRNVLSAPHDSYDYADKILDAWKVSDDINVAKIPFYPALSSSSGSPIQKVFGGFQVSVGLPPVFSWLPHAWSIAVGVNKAFWCEFEVPYNPYFNGQDDFTFNKTDIFSQFPINGQGGLMQGGPFVSSPLPINAKPKLEYYKVERIRDACGPFGVRSTWIADPNLALGQWLVGTDNYNKDKTISRCADWLDIYRKNVADPKIISWRLPRFDYEFLKDFLDCTGPVRVAPPVCRWNKAYADLNTNAAACEAGKAVINTALLVLAEFHYINDAAEDDQTEKSDLINQLSSNTYPIECDISGVGNEISELTSSSGGGASSLLGSDGSGGFGDSAAGATGTSSGGSSSGGTSVSTGCMQRGCFHPDGKAYGLILKIVDNIIRAVDYATRGDTFYGYEPLNGDGMGGNYPQGDPTTDPYRDPLYALEGFRDPAKHSVAIPEYWLQKNDGTGTSYNHNEPFGFWCSCPGDDNKTTRCREDYCTTEQHVMLVGRNVGASSSVTNYVSGQTNTNNTNYYNTYNSSSGSSSGAVINDANGSTSQGTSESGSLLATVTSPVTFVKDYGPMRRWLQCYYQARAKACPVLTRDVSDTPAYSATVDPFPKDRVFQPAITEVSKTGQNFNVCTSTQPLGFGTDNMDQFLRWMREEPNHLARLPVMFESAGGGYKHQDLVEYTQTRDYGPPYMEMAVPFPIDLITRDENPNDYASGNGSYKDQDQGGNMGDSNCADQIANSDDHTSFNKEYGITPDQLVSPSYPCDKRRVNALGEINQREGTGEIDYNNPVNSYSSGGGASPLGTLSDEQKRDELVASASAGASSSGFGNGFRSSLLPKHNTAMIEPSYTSSNGGGTTSTHPYSDSLTYDALYTKYLQGLYAAARSYKHDVAELTPLEPNHAFAYGSSGSSGTSAIVPSSTDKNTATSIDPSLRRINPRAEDAIVGPRGCDIGGWYEMMLYQARCIKWFKLNCICDYDKTFAQGNAVTHALKTAGMSFTIASPDFVPGMQPAGQKFKTEDNTDVHGNKLIYQKPGEVRDLQGLQMPEIKTVNSSNVLNIATGIINKGLDISGVTGESGLSKRNERDYRGNPLIDSTLIGVDINYERKTFPLADRGIVGPEFSPNTNNGSYFFRGLDNVMVGDLIIWDERISIPVNNSPLDVGYPRHIAYVTSVDRVTKGSGSSYTTIVQDFHVSEMNWGKNLDSCGDTDMWGKIGERTIYNPNVVPTGNPITSGSGPSFSDPTNLGLVNAFTLQANPVNHNQTILIPAIPVGSSSGSSLTTNVTDKKPVDKYASCENADWAVCAERYWNQISIYRPYIVNVSANNSGGGSSSGGNGTTIVADPAYSGASCAANAAGFPKPITLSTLIGAVQSSSSGSGNPTGGIAAAEGIPSTVITQGLTAVQQYIMQQSWAGTAGYSYSDIMYNTNKWKLFIDPSVGVYTQDQVDAFLNNPLTGVLDRCDPPAQLRNNCTLVVSDALVKAGITTNVLGTAATVCAAQP